MKIFDFLRRKKVVIESIKSKEIQEYLRKHYLEMDKFKESPYCEICPNCVAHTCKEPQNEKEKDKIYNILRLQMAGKSRAEAIEIVKTKYRFPEQSAKNCVNYVFEVSETIDAGKPVSEPRRGLIMVGSYEIFIATELKTFMNLAMLKRKCCLFIKIAAYWEFPHSEIWNYFDLPADHRLPLPMACIKCGRWFKDEYVCRLPKGQYGPLPHLMTEYNNLSGSGKLHNMEGCPKCGCDRGFVVFPPKIDFEEIS